jgi:uncharacterized protein with PIN domain
MKKIILMLTFILSANLLFAQKDKAKEKSTPAAIVQTSYTCGMHPDVVSNEPGKCPKCGMELIQSKKEQMKMEVMKLYSCPRHPQVTSGKPGKCSKCGMNMIKKKGKSKNVG